MQSDVQKSIQEINETLRAYKAGEYAQLTDLLTFMKEASEYLEKKSQK